MPFPFTDLSGHKLRPVVILYNQKGGEDCIVSFISSVPQKHIGMYDIPINASKLNGLKVNSVIKINKIATLQKKIFLGELGLLESSILEEVDKRLKNLLQIC